MTVPTSLAPTWPKLLCPTNVRLDLTTPSRSGGQSVTGQEQVVVSGASRWALTFTDVPVRTREQIQSWRAIEAQLDGRANAILVPVYDWGRAPALPDRVPFADGVPFSDGAEFRQAVTAIALAANATVNATVLQVTWNGPAPAAGQHFSLGQRVYRVARVDLGSMTGTGRLTIRPWLRDAWSAGTMLNFTNPRCLMRLAKDDGMSLDLEFWRLGHPGVEFVEYY